ncbi:MAG TPA: hypothetical protein VEX64_11650 [Pyrinomonadaceae bacterium]|nr:hypothetical protein [Pyrinomonadaceae bacterium]
MFPTLTERIEQAVTDAKRSVMEMVDRFNKQNTANKFDPISETEFSAVFDAFSRREASHSENTIDDDLISSLQNCRENLRARQVFEWETVRRLSPPAQNYWRGAA